MELTEDPDATFDEIRRLIDCDPALASRILKVVNSSFYGLRGQIQSIDRAILLLGLNAVKNIAIAASVHKLFTPNHSRTHFPLRDLWTHSIAVAAGARLLAENTGLATGDEVFLAGLVHDIGIIIELQTCGPQFNQVIELLLEADTLTFRQAEERVLGATHETFGGALCKAWHFPQNIEHAASFHHRPMEIDASNRVVPALVHAADVLAVRAGAGYSRTVDTLVVSDAILDFLSLAESDLNSVFESLPEAIDEAGQILSISETL